MKQEVLQEQYLTIHYYLLLMVKYIYLESAQISPEMIFWIYLFWMDQVITCLIPFRMENTILE